MIDLSKAVVAPKFRHLDSTRGLADGIATGFSSIRYRGKAWTLNHGGTIYPFRRADDNTPLPYVDFVILDAGPVSRIYFGDEDWNEDSAGAPLCAAADGIAPDPGVSVPQAKTCASCSHSQWITRPNGRRGKECQEHKRVAVLLMPSMTAKMLNAPLLEPVYLKIPPGSLTSWKAYSEALVHRGLPPPSLVTRIAFASDKLFEMTFAVVQMLTDREADTVLPMIESPQTKAIIGASPLIRTIAAPEPGANIDTGLLEAFGEATVAPLPPQNGGGGPAVVPKKRGRPKMVTATAAPAPAPTPTPAPAAAAAAPQATDEGYDESDTDLDDTVANLLSGKMGDTFK